ncbi:cell envelope-related function transcriptional attenuator common domain-containing protein [Halobacillus karajensis]|uniref:Membrane-bound protein LytR n=1 Tax=Halobacillus karajensis TaxID=195088 RepID=A0A024P3U7_9BACI|nr:LCP family protein [Halobacillus karajensis]CDQ19136.1 Membrane-bound protein LytR [Halobacillus karajensis]CDQ22790.1 Membrane-bound protein LytR [Halobacillus karajensis]CDQ26272.1 Membrane-bound protein LytR [Halobacillus karajensis]SEH41073.1 cell envelope-related function transcriptional attenuator common domain-containing protein [Halobacillus karajensis]
MSRSQKHKKKKGRWWKVSLVLLILLLVPAGVYAYSLYSGAKSTVDSKMHKQVASIDHKVTEKKRKEREPLNILLMGVDERAGDSGRSDALMVLSLDPNNNRSQMISIPRDTRTEMVGDSAHAGTLDKINHAYAFGGADMAILTVENFLDIDLDYYVQVNMEGLEEMVDAVGGITIQNEIEWYGKDNFHYKKGELTMNGKEALGYVRMRYDDPKGDMGRNERQRKVIQGIVDKGMNVGSINKIDDVMDVLGKNVSTNMNFSTMQDLMKNYSDARENLSTYQMTGTGTKIGGIYYLEVPDQEVQEVREMILDYNS